MILIIGIGLPRLPLHLCHPLTSLGWPSSWLASLTGLSVAPIIPVLIGYLQCPPNQFIPLGCSHFLSCLFFFLNWSIVGLQYFRCTAKWFGYMYYIHILFFRLFSIIGYYKILTVLEKEMVAHSSIWPGEFHGQRSLVGYSPWGRQESDTTERLTHTHTHTILTIVPCPV